METNPIKSINELIRLALDPNVSLTVATESLSAAEEVLSDQREDAVKTHDMDEIARVFKRVHAAADTLAQAKNDGTKAALRVAKRLAGLCQCSSPEWAELLIYRVCIASSEQRKAVSDAIYNA